MNTSRRQTELDFKSHTNAKKQFQEKLIQEVEHSPEPDKQLEVGLKKFIEFLRSDCPVAEADKEMGDNGKKLEIRNHVIARVFRELNLIEQWGSGIPRIFREAEELGLPDLDIMEIGMRIRFTVPLAGQLRIQESTEQVTEQVRRILVCLKDAPMGARAAMQYLGLRHRPTFLYDYLQPALGADLVEMTQPESPKSPTQKYRLTQKGEAILAGRDQSESGQ